MALRLIKDFLKIVIECLTNAFLLTFFFMYFYMSIKEKGWKEALNKWKENFLGNNSFRKVFFLVLYSFIVLVKTVLSRSIWHDPYGRIFSDWSIIDEFGQINLSIIENFLLFIPFTFFLLWNLDNFALRRDWGKKVVFAILTGFLFSLGIELIQLILRLGTFQFSDLFYNTMGGVLGSVIYITLSLIIKTFLQKADKNSQT